MNRKPHTDIAKKNISNSLKGKTPWNKGKKIGKMSDGAKAKLSLRFKGKKRPLWVSEKLRKSARKGSDSHLWKGGITPINLKIRMSFEYRLWREAVFKRDNYQCIWGGKEHGNKLNADHIKPFALFPELRFAIDNGRTLCVDCHKKTDTFGARVMHRN